MQLVGNYRMFHLIRAGAEFEIWAVRPAAENTAYAMKWLPPGELHTREMVSVLRHEYAVGKSLDHPNIINVYEFNSTKAGSYVILELFRHPNVKQWIQTGLDHIHYMLKEVLINITTSLAHLHSKGWVHRDIKPDNFLMDENGQIRLIDFNLTQKQQTGLAKLFGGKSKVQGTHSYMAPEQIRGKGIDFHSDIYSLGCMIHELVCGKVPFTANSPNELLTKHLRSRPPSLTVGNPNITEGFAALVNKMLAKDPKDRVESMEQLSKELKVQRIFRTTPAKPAPKEGEESQD